MSISSATVLESPESAASAYGPMKNAAPGARSRNIAIRAALRPEKFGPAMSARAISAHPQGDRETGERQRHPGEIDRREASRRRVRERAVDQRQRVLGRPFVARAADRNGDDGEPYGLHQQPAVAQVSQRRP